MIMGNFMNKQRVPVAIDEHSKNDLGHQHITSQDFMQLSVAMSYEMSPGQSIDIKDECFAQLNPLPVPTFGRASMRIRSFFVPYRTCFRAFTDMIVDSVHVGSSNSSSSSLVTSVPYVTNADLVGVFINHIVSKDDVHPCDGDGLLYEVSFGTPGTPDSSFDVAYVYSNNSVSYYNFTVLGRRFICLLEQLGYKLVWRADYVGKNKSALPLLALARLYLDYYYPNQYTNRVAYDDVMKMCNNDVGSGYTWNVQHGYIYKILDMVSYVQYDQDYFTAQFDSPVTPGVGNLSTSFSFPDVTVSGNSSHGLTSIVMNDNTNNTYSTPRIIGVSHGGTIGSTTAPMQISEYTLHTLHALSDFLKRNQISSRSIDRYLARFGKKLPVEALNRSVYLGCGMQNIQIGDIMSTADTDGASLGSFAGKGISYGNSHFQYDADEYGMLFVIASIVPVGGYYQGIDGQLNHLTRTDFYQPELDANLVQATPASELFVPQYAPTNIFNTIEDQVFAYFPKGAENKCKNDKLTGNFRLMSINGTNPLYNGLVGLNAANSWHLMRTFKEADFPNGASDIVHSYNFVDGRADNLQYKRIFYNNDPCAPDNFTVIHNFEIAAHSPWRSLFDNYEFENQGKEITMDVNGVKMN